MTDILASFKWTFVGTVSAFATFPPEDKKAGQIAEWTEINLYERAWPFSRKTKEFSFPSGFPANSPAAKAVFAQVDGWVNGGPLPIGMKFQERALIPPKPRKTKPIASGNVVQLPVKGKSA